MVAAVRAHLDEHGNCHSTTGTLSRRRAGGHRQRPDPQRDRRSRRAQAALGPGFRANATIGRALRLVIRNVCRAVPGFLDRATFCGRCATRSASARTRRRSDWTPLHVQRGYAPEQSTATVQSVMRMVSAWDSTSRTPEGVLDSIVAETRYQFGFSGDEFLGDDINVVYIMGKEHQRFFIEEGWSKEQMQEYMWPAARRRHAGAARPLREHPAPGERAHRRGRRRRAWPRPGSCARTSPGRSPSRSSGSLDDRAIGLR